MNLFMSRVRIAPLVAAFVLLAGSQQRASGEIDFGTIENSVYSNSFFGLTVQIPEHWHPQDQEVQRRFQKGGANLVLGHTNLTTGQKASFLQTVSLFAVTKYAAGTPANPNIGATAERVSQLPDIGRGSDYLRQVKKLFESGQFPVSFPKEIYPEKIGGQLFDVLEIQIAMPKSKLRQTYYSTIMKGYALNFSISFNTDEDELTLRNIVKTARFGSHTESRGHE